MISLSFVNGEYEYLPASDDFSILESAMQEASDEIDNYISSYMKLYDDYMFESEIFGSLSEDKELVLESGKDNVFKKIGEAIIAIFKKFEEAAKKVIEKIKEIGFKSKTDTDKLNKLLKQRPELKDEIICAYKSGDLNVADAKNLKELDKAFDEIIQLSKQKDVKPDTLRGKVEAMKKKFKDPDNAQIVKTAKAATAVIGAAVAVVTFKKYVLDARRATNEYTKSCAEKNKATIEAIEKLKKRGEEMGEDYVSDSLSKAQILKNANLYISGAYGDLISKEQGKVEKLDKGITSFIAKHMKKESHDFIEKMDKASEMLKKEEKDERKKERKKNKQDAKDRTKASEKAKLEFREENKEKYKNFNREDAREKAYGSEDGKMRYRQANEDMIRKANKQDAHDRTYSGEEAKMRYDKDHSKELERKAFRDARNKAAGSEMGKEIINKKYEKRRNQKTVNNAYYSQAGRVDYDHKDYTGQLNNGESKLREIDRARRNNRQERENDED